MEREGGTPAGAGDLADESTLAGDDAWPVDDRYFVEPTDGPPPALVEEERRSSRLAAYAIGLAVVLAALGLGAWFVLRDDSSQATAAQSGRQAPPPSRQAASPSSSSSTTTPTAPVKAPSAVATVPDATGLAVGSARAQLEQAGLRARVRRHSSSAPRDQVLEQSPSSGAKVKRNALVLLTVSAGPPRVVVPQLVGLQAGAAARKVRALKLVPLIRLVRSARPAGAVLGQSPASGALLEPREHVRLEVAKSSTSALAGSAGARVSVPDVVGLAATTARRRLAAAGLRATVVQVPSAEPQQTVVRESPGAGAQVRRGSSVRLGVSSGAAQVAVPSVVGLDRQSAQDQLQSAGFQVQVVTQPTNDPSQDGTVTAQDPEGGTRARDGSTVTLTVAQLG